MNLRQMFERRTAIASEMKQICAAPAGGDDLSPEQDARFNELQAEAERLEQRIQRQATVDEMERRATGTPIGGGGDRNLTREVRARYSLLRRLAHDAGMKVDAGFELEVDQELRRTAGRSFQGAAVPAAIFHDPVTAERRTLLAASDTAGGYLVQTDVGPVIDRLRQRLVMRRLGATVLSGLQGNLDIPRLSASASSGWVAENQAITATTHGFEKVALTPKHAGAITEISRNMLLQSSADVEALVRADFANILANAVDVAAINGSGAGAEPMGLLRTNGIGSVDMSTLTWSDVLEFFTDVENANGEGTGWLTNPKVVALLMASLKVSGDAAGGFIMTAPRELAGYPVEVTTNVPSTLGAGSNKSALIFGAWSDVLVGYWSELDILVNPYEATTFSKGNVQVRGIITCDVAIRHPESFSAAQDIAA